MYCVLDNMTGTWQIIRNTGGVGFTGLSGVIFKIDTLAYTAGGFALPIKNFTPIAVVSVTAENGGISGYYSNKKLLLYKDGAEASGSLTDVTVVMLGQ